MKDLTSFTGNIIYDKLMELGVFIYHNSEKNWIEYKYYPKYMIHTHYSLVLYKKHPMGSLDFRLYIHNNADDTYNDSLFQISDYSEWNINYLNEQINKIFKKEFRKLKLKNIYQNE